MRPALAAFPPTPPPAAQAGEPEAVAEVPAGGGRGGDRLRAREALATRYRRATGAVQRRFDARDQAGRHQRLRRLRQALLALELVCKLEEQVIAPSLDEAGLARLHPGALHLIAREIDLMRDLAAAAPHSDAQERALVCGVLAGLSQMHFDRVHDWLMAVPAEGADWRAADDTVRALRRQWRSELARLGALEDDEDGDPVGHPPR